MRGMQIGQIAEQVGLVSGCDLQVSGYQIDSRNIRPGDLFFALKGEKNDGHDFLEEVRKKGAIGAVVAKSYSGPDYGLVLLKVEDVAFSLRDLARISLLGSSLQIVGITGSVGKTTTKDFTATLLEGKYRVGKTLQSQNSKLTLPLTVLNRSHDIEVLVLEMGMSEPGDIQRLVEMAPPDIAVITHVALAHAAYFPGGLPEIAKGKGEIFSHPKTRMAIFDREFLKFGIEIHCEKQIFSPADFDGMPFKEPHILHNLGAAIEVARAMKMSDEEIQKQIPHLQLPKMRFEQLKKDGIHFINDAYNANPESMRAALFSLGMIKTDGKRIAVLGTMKELGSFSHSQHQEIGRFAQKYVDHLLVLGEEARPLVDTFCEEKQLGEFFLNHKEIARRLKEIAKDGDVVLIKGSRSMNMDTILDIE